MGKQGSCQGDREKDRVRSVRVCINWSVYRGALTVLPVLMWLAPTRRLIVLTWFAPASSYVLAYRSRVGTFWRVRACACLVNHILTSCLVKVLF